MGDMERKLFLLDGMALVYRGHFAMIRNPRMSSTGMNTSTLFVFANTLLDILGNEQPSHIAVVFDTPEPTYRHRMFEDYKAQREVMPEDLSAALPYIFRMCEGFNIPVLRAPGWEADDVIGTLAQRAEGEGFTTYMVTPDKDFGQLVSGRTFICKPGRTGSAEVLVAFSWGMPGILLFAVTSFFLESINRPLPGMIVMIAANLVNAGLNWLFIYGHWGLPAMGAEGAATTTSMVRWLMFAALAGAMLSTLLTPGGLGFVEIGLVGVLKILGLGDTAAFTLMVVDRSISLISIIVIGGALFFAWQIFRTGRHPQGSVPAMRAESGGGVEGDGQ